MLDSRTYGILQNWEARGLVGAMPDLKPYARNDIYTALLSLNDQDSLLTTTDRYWKTQLTQRMLNSYHSNKKWKGGERYNFDWDEGFTLFDRGNSSYNIMPFIEFIQGVEQGKIMKAEKYGVDIRMNLSQKVGIDFRYTKDWVASDYYPLWRDFSSNYGATSRANDPTGYSYANVIFNLGANFKWISFNIGHNAYKVGEAENGQIILSDKAAPFANIRFDIHPARWIQFSYFHGSLFSLQKNQATYPTNDTSVLKYSDEYRSKYIAYHSLTLRPWKNIQFTVGELVTYSDKFQFLYLMPLLPFVTYVDNQYNGGQAFGSIDNPNSRIFFTSSWKNLIPRTSMYAEVMVDEIVLSKTFSNQSRNQLAYTLGIRLYDYLMPQSSLTIEYTHNNPFIYKNINPAQTFENSGVVMGHWLRDDADIIYASLKKQFGVKWDINSWVKYVRKGYSGSYTDQYAQGFSTTFDFLQNGVKNYYNEMGVSAYYHLKNTLHFYAEYLFRDLKGDNAIRDLHTFRVGFRLGIL